MQMLINMNVMLKARLYCLAVENNSYLSEYSKVILRYKVKRGLYCKIWIFFLKNNINGFINIDGLIKPFRGVSKYLAKFNWLW